MSKKNNIDAFIDSQTNDRYNPSGREPVDDEDMTPEDKIYNQGMRAGKIDCLKWLCDSLEGHEDEMDVKTLREMLQHMYDVSIETDLEHNPKPTKAAEFTKEIKRRMGLE